MPENTSQSVDTEDSPEDFVRDAREKYRKARNHNARWKKRARKAYDYYAGRQWTDDEMSDLGDGKAPVVMNRIKPRVSAVVGMEISNRQELRYHPREKNDERLISLINKASEWTRDQAETEDHETEQFKDMVISGMGWSSTMMDYSNNPDGIAVVERKTPLGYDWDSDARQANLTDMEFFFYSQDVSREQYKALGFPMSEAHGGALGVNQLWEQKHNEPEHQEDAKWYPNEVPEYPGAQRGGPLKRIRLVRMEYIKRVKFWRVALPDGSTKIMDPNKTESLNAMAIEMGFAGLQMEEFDANQPLRSGGVDVAEGRLLVVPYVEQVEKRYRRAWFSGDNLLDDGPNPCPFSFSDECMTGWHDENEGTFFGMVDGLIDPQDWSNKFFSQAIYIYTVNPKGGAFVKRKAVNNPSTFEKNFAAPDAVNWMSDDANLKEDIIERRPGQYPSDLDKLMAFAIDSLPALDGLTPELMGQVSRDQPGILENMRKQASMLVLAVLFSAKRRYHKRQGRTLLHYITMFFTDSQLARIVGEPIPPELLELLRNQDVRNYDVIVDDAPTSPNAKEYNLNILMEFVRQAPSIAGALSPMLIKNSSLDFETQEEVLKAIEVFTKPENTPQGQAAQQEIQRLTEENRVLKSKEKIEGMKLAAKITADAARIGEEGDKTDMQDDLARDLSRDELEFKFEELEQELTLKLMEMRNQLAIAKTGPENGVSNG